MLLRIVMQLDPRIRSFVAAPQRRLNVSYVHDASYHHFVVFIRTCSGFRGRRSCCCVACVLNVGAQVLGRSYVVMMHFVCNCLLSPSTALAAWRCFTRHKLPPLFRRRHCIRWRSFCGPKLTCGVDSRNGQCCYLWNDIRTSTHLHVLWSEFHSNSYKNEIPVGFCFSSCDLCVSQAYNCVVGLTLVCAAVFTECCMLLHGIINGTSAIWLPEKTRQVDVKLCST